MRVNIKPSRLSNRPIHEPAATVPFDPAWELDRMVSCCLLGERQFYVDGVDIEERIRELAHHCDANFVQQTAIKARQELGLRHAPLLLLVALANRQDGAYGPLIRAAARSILRTPRDAMDLYALYWQQGKKPLPHTFKAAIRDGFGRWTEFQIRRYGTMKNVAVRLRDLLFMARPDPGARTELFQALANDALVAADTWEVALTRAEDKRAEWHRLLTEGKLGALALVRNLRNMIDAGVPIAAMETALDAAKAQDVWPWQALTAAREAPACAAALERLMLRSMGQVPTLPGITGVLVDVSGSMDDALSAHSTMRRMDAAAGLAVVLKAACERVAIASFSNLVVPVEDGDGLMLALNIVNSQMHGGTPLGASVRAFCQQHPELTRLVVVTDEQSQDHAVWPRIPCFVVNLASYQRGVIGEGEVMRINGWSGGIVRYLAGMCGASLSIEDETE